MPLKSVLTINTSEAGCYKFAMSRKLRIKYRGATYHLMNRGDQSTPLTGIAQPWAASGVHAR